MTTQPTPTPAFLTIRDLAARWQCSPSQARRITHSGGFPPAYRFSERVVRWDADAVAAWETAQATGPVFPVSAYTPRPPGAVGPRPRGVVTVSPLGPPRPVGPKPRGRAV
jgi:predicted DNA-binding transcriptional regulator AlpA